MPFHISIDRRAVQMVGSFAWLECSHSRCYLRKSLLCSQHNGTRELVAVEMFRFYANWNLQNVMPMNVIIYFLNS